MTTIGRFNIAKPSYLNINNDIEREAPFFGNQASFEYSKNQFFKLTKGLDMSEYLKNLIANVGLQKVLPFVMAELKLLVTRTDNKFDDFAFKGLSAALKEAGIYNPLTLPAVSQEQSFIQRIIQEIGLEALLPFVMAAVEEWIEKTPNKIDDMVFGVIKSSLSVTGIFTPLPRSVKIA